MNGRRRGRVRQVSRAAGQIGLVALAFAWARPANAQQKMLYSLSNDIQENRNAVLAFQRQADGALAPHPAGPFPTRGTGIDNDTNGKLGPNDNDTPLAVSGDGRFLFAVNGHSNTIAAFSIESDGSLAHVEGSPFPSMGVGPVSIAVTGSVLVVANRNEDPHQLDALRGGARANYASFRIRSDGSLSFVSAIESSDGGKGTQVLVSSLNDGLVFANEFVVDVDFDGDGSVSRLFGKEAVVAGGLRSFWIDEQGGLNPAAQVGLPETVDPAPEVPSIPLGIWDHPTRPLLYVGLVTRNQLGVYRYDERGSLAFVAAVPNSGQDICWLKVSADGRRLYAVNNLPREEMSDAASTVTVFDISGQRAERPVEIGRVELPHPTGTFLNNRAISQPGSTAFQFDLDEADGLLYVVSQRIDQTAANGSPAGNYIHSIRIQDSGELQVVASRPLIEDGVSPRARPQGVLLVEVAR